MTLKEQTIKRIEFQQEHNEKDQKEYGRVSLFDKLELKYLESLLKDLEVLEIMRKNINIANNGFTICGNYYDEKDFKKEDFRKIKEWLEDDNNNR